MSDDKQKLKIVVAPNVLEQLEQEMSPEELQQLLNDLQKMAEDGTFMEQAQLIDLDELKVSDPELYEQLMAFDEVDEHPTLH